MQQPVPWFQRTFDTSASTDLLPGLLVRLRGTPARLEEFLHGYAADALTRHPEGKWSAQEHAGHLLDLEPLWLKRLGDFLEPANTELSPTDLQNRRTHDANHNATPLAQLLADFRAARHRLIEAVEPLDPALFSRTLIHPRLRTPLRLFDHLAFVAEHDDHHLAVIWQQLHG